MPIYEYECDKCRCSFETFVFSSKEESSVQCPKCGGAEVKRILSCFSTSGVETGQSGGACSPGPGRFS
jgi:putative FmdB family regulatory protein